MLLSTAAAFMPAYALNAVLCGSVYSTTDDAFASGVYELPLTSTGSFNLVAAIPDHKATGGGFFADGIYYVGELNNSYSFYGGLNLYPYNTEGWTPAASVYLSSSPAVCGMSSGFAVTSAGLLYGGSTDTNRQNNVFYSYKADVAAYDLDFTKIGDLGEQLGAYVADADGTVYGINADGALFTVSTTDASVTKVGDTGLKPLVDGQYWPFMHASSVYDAASGKIYTAVLDANGLCSLYTIDPATAATTKVTDYPAGHVVTGLYMAEAKAEAGAPSAATELEADFAPGKLSGTISFKAPGTTYGGTELTANLDYRVLANGKEVANGKVYSNVTAMVDVTVPERGMYEFTVIVSNSVGDGPAAKVKAAVGYAAPAAPQVTTSAYGSSVQIQWSPVETTADGDPIQGDVSYKVVRYPDGKVVEESTTWTSVWDYGLGDDLKAYQYAVVAYCNGTPSEEGLSPVIVAGSAKAPYSEAFAEADVMNLYTIIDANNDTKTWDFYYGEVRSAASDDVDGDDWLISPPFSLQSDKYYVVSLDARVYNPDLPGKFEIFAGDAPTAEAMTTRVLEPSYVSSESLTTYTGLLHAEGYGNKYIGIHSITEKGNWWLFATNFKVSAAYEGTVPAAPTDFTARSAYDGSNSVSISLKAPLTDLSGNQLSSLEKVEIRRGDAVVHTVENPVPGQLIEWVDTEVGEGEIAYSAMASNYSGEGIPATCVGFAGVNLPATVTEVYAYSTDEPGYVRVEWKPVATFIDGTPMDPSLVTYNIYTDVTGQDMMIAKDLTGTSATFKIFQATEEEPQLFFRFGVTAQTSGGENTKGVYSEYVALGEAYTLPYEESFPDLNTKYLSLQGGSDPYSYWDNASDKTFEEVQSHDDDNGMIAMFSQYRGSKAYFKTGLIDLADATNPMLTFYAFNLVDPSLADNNTIEVQVGYHNEFKTLATITLEDFKTEGWHRVEVPLSEFAGKEIQVNLIGTVNSYQYIHVDNFKVMDRRDNDIAVTLIEVPERVKSGNCANIHVGISNLGLKTADKVNVELYRDGEMVDSEEFTNVESDARIFHHFPALHTVATPESVEYQVKLTATSDSYADNDLTEAVSVMTIFPNYPTVTDLAATYAEGDDKNIKLSWSTPDLTAAFADDITEGFEEVRTWTTNGLNGWTFVDNDKQLIYGFRFFDVPTYAPQPDTQQSWFSMSDTYQPMAEHFSDPGFYKAHGGHQYLSSMAVTTGEPEYTQRRTDDWAISPLLYGGQQTISFWAKSMLADALEQMEILYSTTGTDIADFQLLTSVKEVPWAWTQYFAKLPEGAKYFAIRNHSRDAYVLMIDDVNFTPAADAGALELSGYNIYRNGVCINSEAVKGNTFTDLLDGVDSPEYTVTALYANRGESAFSNVATPALDGIGCVEASDVKVFASAGCVNVIGAAGSPIAVYSVDGRCVASQVATGHDCIAVAPGVYVVKVGSKAVKLTVR